MAVRIPTYERQVGLASYQLPRADAGAFAAVGRAVADVGGQMGQVADLSMRRAAQLEQAEAEDYVATQFAYLTAAQSERFFTEQNKAPPGASGFTKSFMEQFDKDIEARVQSAPSDLAKQALKERAQSMRESFHRNSLVFERDAGVAYRRGNLETSVSKLANVAISNPGMYGDLHTQLNDAIDLHAKDFNAQELAELRQKANGSLATAAISGTAERDPAEAIRQLDSGEWDDRIEPGQKLQLRGRAEAEIRSQEAERRRQAAEAKAEARAAAAEARAARQEAQFSAKLMYQDELAAAARGETASPDTDKRIAQAFDPKDAELMLNRLRVIREEGTLGKELATMPAADIQSAIEGRAPAGEGYADEADSQERLARVASDVLKRRQDDPAAEAARAFPEIGADMASGDPVRMAAAVRRTMQVQRETFGLAPDQIKPLSEQAADRTVELWKAAPTTDEKLALLDSFVRMPDAEGKPDTAAGRAVLDQLEKSGLPEGIDIAMEAYLGGRVGPAREMMSALSLKPEDLPKLGDATATEVKTAIADLAQTEAGSAVDAQVAVITGQASAAQAFARNQNVIERLTKQQVAAGVDPETAAAKADKLVNGDGPVIADDSLAAVRLPVGADADAVADGLETLRAGVDLSWLAPSREKIAGMLPQGAAAGEVEAAYQMALRDHQRWADAIRESGVFINQGDGFALVNTVPGPYGTYGRAIAGPDGKPKVWTLDEVLKPAAATPADPAAVPDVPKPPVVIPDSGPLQSTTGLGQ